MPLLVPDVIFRNVTRIAPCYLAARGIRALVLDVDNTLAAHGSQRVSAEVAAWIEAMRAAGVLMMLASNNTKSRVRPFAKKLGLPCASFCCKPLPRWLAAAQKRWRLPRRAIALVGDQIFTDLLAGGFAGTRVLMVRPLYKDIKPMVRLKRVLEAPLVMRYYKNGGRLG